MTKPPSRPKIKNLAAAYVRPWPGPKPPMRKYIGMRMTSKKTENEKTSVARKRNKAQLSTASTRLKNTCSPYRGANVLAEPGNGSGPKPVDGSRPHRFDRSRPAPVEGPAAPA